MMKRIWAVIVLTLVATAAQAESEIDTVREALAQALPGLKIESITPAPMPGLYEVVVGTQILYISRDGRFVVEGDLVDAKSRENLTENRRAAQRLKLLATLDPKSMIVFGPRQPRHRITVFTDTDCAYCRRMHEQIAQYNRLGIEVRYVGFARAGIGSKTYNTMVSVWCADDRNKALTDAKTGRSVPSRRCQHPLEQHMKVAEQLGISGTPTLLLEDGTLLPGYVPPERLAKALDQAD